MKHILTPDEFVVRNVAAYPSLFASPSYDETKFRILDHALNTIGNGLYAKDFIGDPNNDDDVANFIHRKWAKERQRILSFIDNTIEMLNSLIADKKEVA